MTRTAPSPVTLAIVAALLLGLGACSGDVGGVVQEDPASAAGQADPEPGPGEELGTMTNYNLPIGAEVEVCRVNHGLNNRSGPSTGYMVLRVLHRGERARTLRRSGNWYRLDAGGRIGWSYGRYLCQVSAPAPLPTPSPSPTPTPSPSTGNIDVSRDGIINASRAFVGFSYWWGGAAFRIGSTALGKCYSSTYGGHSGSYGADCSGFVGKVWQLPGAMPFERNLHPYSTYHFYNQTNHWNHISRSSTQRADALVYRSGGSGHIVIYERGDAWGQAWTYEARGCSYGVVHNLRSISSSYRARRRHGI